MRESKRFLAGILALMMAFSSSLTAAKAEETEIIEDEQPIAETEADSDALEELQAAIDALPGTLLFSEDIAADYDNLLALKEAYDALSEEDQAQIDFTKAETLLDYNSNTLNPENLEMGNSLEGKVIGYLGSSITQGFRSNGVAFPEYIGQLSGSTTIKQAIPGGTLALKEGYREEASYIYQLLNGALKDVEHLDALVVQLSTNDVTAEIPIGELTDSFASEDQDYGTVLGAMEYISAYAREKWDCPVMFYINAYLSDEACEDFAAGDEETLKVLHEQYQDNYVAMIEALYKVAEKWNLGVTDLWNNDDVKATTLRLRKFFMDDPIHPHKAGYWFWYTKPIMETLEETIASYVPSIDESIVEPVEIGNAYKYTSKRVADENTENFYTSAYIVYADEKMDEAKASALLNDLGMVENMEQYGWSAIVTGPAGDAYGAEDLEIYSQLLDASGSMFDINVLGVGKGADFVNEYVTTKDYAVSGFVTIDASSEADYGEIPAYVTSTENETLAEAFANGWDNAFSKTFKIGNIGGTFYNRKLSEEREFEWAPFTITSNLGITRTVVKADLDGDGVDSLWYEYIPAAAGTEEGTVPMVLLLHGNQNDPRTQYETSGWAQLAAEEGIILVEAEWQGTSFGADPIADVDLAGAMLQKVFEKYPQIDQSRVYVEGLSAGSAKTLTMLLTHPEAFATGGSHSGAVIGNSTALETAVEELKDKYDVPYFFIGGEKDSFVPVSEKGGANSGVLKALNLFEKMNGMSITSYEDCDESKVEWFGFTKMEDFGEVENDGSCVIKGGTIKNDEGQTMMSFNAIENWGHWNYAADAKLMWDFFKNYSRDPETGELIIDGEEETGIVEPVEIGNAYKYTSKRVADENTENFYTSAYIVCADEKMSISKASALLEELGMVENMEQYGWSAIVTGPAGDAYGAEDLEIYSQLLDASGSMFDINVLGIGKGADFVNEYITTKDYAVSGFVTIDASSEADYGEIPAYVTSTEKETLAEAFANGWKNAFSKTFKIGNIGGTFYNRKLSEEREFEWAPFTITSNLGITRTVVKADLDGDGVDSLWYEYVPRTASRTAGSVPMVLLLHGNTNDPRTQYETSGWAQVAAEEGIILVEAEWQGTSFGADPIADADLAGAMLQKVFEKYPQIDQSRVYVEGLSAGSAKTLTLSLTYPGSFAAGGSHSGAAMGNSTALNEAVAANKDKYDMAWYFIGGEKDSFVPVSEKGGANSGVLRALNLFEELNDMSITSYEDCDESAVQWFGFKKLTDFGEIENDGSCVIKGGTVRNDDNQPLMSFNVIENWGHWNYAADAKLMWEFFQNYSRDTETGELIISAAANLDETDFGYVYDRTAFNTEEGRLSYVTPTYLIYPDTKLDKAGAAALLEEMNIIDHIKEYDTKAYVINPVGNAYDQSADLDNYLAVLDTLGFAGNIKVIGVGKGGEFVDKVISKNAWPVAGIMTYNSKANMSGSTEAVPAYVSNAFNVVNQYYIRSADGEKIGTEGKVELYQNPDNDLINVAVGTDTTLADAFANAWKYVFSKNYRMYNDEEECYTAGLTKYRSGYRFNPYPMYEELGLTYESKTGLITANATEAKPNQWYEVFPEEIDTAPEASIPLLVVLHGNGNDNRTQLETSGWPTKAGEERFAIIAAEWQASRTAAIFNKFTALGEAGTVALVQKVLEEHPALDPGKVYMQGLSAGASSTYNYGINHSDIFTAVQGSSAPGLQGSTAMTDKANEIREAGTGLPAYVLAGSNDVYKPIPTTRGNGLIRAYAAANGIDTPETLDFNANKYYGLQLENQGYYDFNGQNALAGTLSNDMGVMMKVVAMEPYAHWNNPLMVDDIWEFFNSFRRNQETGKIEMDVEEPEINDTIVEDTDFGFVYDRMAYNTVDGRLPYITPIYLIYPDARVDRKGAEALLYELDIVDHIDEYDAKAYVINPYDRSYEDRADLENYLRVLDSLGFAGNIKVIGIGNGANFVDRVISKNAWPVAGIMTYNSKANMKGSTEAVPAYVSNGYNVVGQYYIRSADAEKIGTEGKVECYQSPDNELINVAIGTDATMADAFANAWKYVFSKNYRMYNEEEECYTAGLTKYRSGFNFNPYPMYDELGLTYESKTGLITANATEGKPNQWYVVFPEEIDEAEEASIPLIVVLHGNGNDNRTQLESSGWATKAGKERIALIAPEWQASRGTVIFGNYTALAETGTVDLVKKVLAENPALDPGRVYVQGLSAGANSAYTYAMNHNDVFTASQGSSSPFMTGSAALTRKAEEIRAAGTYLPTYVLAGTADVYRPIPTTRGNGLLTAYAAANDIDVPAEMDFTANKYYGIQLDDQGYYNINGQNVLAGTLSNDLGVMMKVVAMEPYAHWNNPLMIDDIWEFWSQYRRNPETGKIEMTEKPFEFDDVQDPSKYYYDPVYWAYNHDPQITTGTTATTFSPEDKVSRGQFVTFLYRAAGEPDVDVSAIEFTDVKAGSYYEKAVAWAVENKITTGLTADTFGPNDKVSRAQIVTFLYRYAGEPEVTGEIPFTDVKAGAYYADPVLWAYNTGVTTGTTATKFSPNSICTRGQAVTFLYRVEGE